MTAELLSWDVSSLIERLAQIRELEEKGFVYGEKEEALYFKEEIEALIRRELYLTDEEIEAAIPLANDEDEMLALAEVCRQRILEEQAK